MTRSDPLASLVGASAAMEHVRAQLVRLSSSAIPVMIVGETGTGKEVCATAIAALSDRQPLAAVNCAAFPESLVESELFGHERGAFTGAIRAHPGVIGQAHRGTLFLDELQEVPPPVQVKLLRTLESGEYRPVGSTSVRHSEFRILTATNKNPDELVAAGRLRSDLLYRLGCTRVWLPPLRLRREDIPLLAAEFLRRYAERSQMSARILGARARAYLMEQDWPGNVRQLLHVLEAAAVIAGSSHTIEVEHLVEVLAPQSSPELGTGTLRLAVVRRKAEQSAIFEALRVASGNREQAASLLGISAATLYRKISPLEGSA